MRALLLAAALVSSASPAYAGPLDGPVGVPCRVESFRDLAGITWADPNHRLSTFAAGPMRIAGAASVTIRCAVYKVWPNGTRELLADEVNTMSGDTVVLLAGVEERWMNGGDPPIACTTVSWRAPGGDGTWPSTGESCEVVDELPVVP